MKSIIRALSSFIPRAKRMSDEEFYYSQATDLVELEYRMKQVQKGQAPFQDSIKSW